MKKVTIKLNKNKYNIFIKKNIIKKIPQLHKKNFHGRKAFIITDNNVAKYYLKNLLQDFQKLCIVTNFYKVKPGENSKSFSCVQKICDALLKDNINRDDIIYALGGGVVGDLTGFISSIILRGVKFVQIPTTLLSQVDSSVGGKTGINSFYGKNLIGSFYQPKAVFIDVNTLKTLPFSEYISGYSEVLKYALINDINFFKILKKNEKKILKMQTAFLENIIAKCCKAKANIVVQDEKESNKRMLLNLGHTFAHAIEAELNFKIRHGEAVALGLLMALKLSFLKKKINNNDFVSVQKHLRKMKLPTSLKEISNRKIWSATSLIKKMQKDKKINKNKLRFILCNGIGSAYISSSIVEKKIVETIKEFSQ